MKKLITLIGLFLITISSYSQMSTNLILSPAAPYKVGDTITVSYKVIKDTTTPRYFWLRYTYNTSTLTYVPSSTTFSQGTSSQTYYTSWNNYVYQPYANSDAKSLYAQYQHTPWSYVVAGDWNVGQVTVQRTDASVDGVVASQKYVIKNSYVYDGIFKMSMAYSINAAGAYITPINGGNDLSLGTVTGSSSTYNVRIAYPTGDTSITNLKALITPLNADSSVNTNITATSVKFDAQGIATFTNTKVGEKYKVSIIPPTAQTYLNNIITVSDAYKSFLGIAEVGITGGSKYFTYPTLEQKIGNVTIGDNTFDNNDAYYSFAYVMGIDVTSKTTIPSSTATSVGFLYGKKSAWASGVLTDNIITVAAATQTDDFAYAYAGDLNYSNSTDPSLIAGAVAGQSVNTSSRISSNSTGPIASLAYTPAPLQNLTMGLTSTIDANGKVVLTTTLTQDSLAGIEVILQYDNTKLTLDNVSFDAGPSVTNFSTDNNSRLTFGSIDQNKTARIKKGTPYKLIFTPKSPLTSTAGLFYTVLADAVDSKGNKINLTVE